MRKREPIPVNSLSEEFQSGIVVGRVIAHSAIVLDEANYAHRHDYHIFLIIREGTGIMEIDFKKHKLKPPAILYMHPSQVHRVHKIKKSSIDAFMLGVKDENIYAHYFQLLEQNIAPAEPLLLKEEAAAAFYQAIDLCYNIFQKKEDRLYLPLLKDSCNTFIGLFVSQYLQKQELVDESSRYNAITRAFRLLLEKNFTTMKRPAEYAEMLHVSVSYLNECVKVTTGNPVSYHIRQRVVLEAKRLLYHSLKTVKEIAVALGYDDYAYFSRLFTKTTGVSAMTFRNKNRD